MALFCGQHLSDHRDELWIAGGSARSDLVTRDLVVVTSYANQAKTVDRVLIGQSAASFLASSREQFYVSVSRGREQATIHTDDKQSLLDAVKQSDERVSATELVADAMRERAMYLGRLRQIEATTVPAHSPNHDRVQPCHDRQLS